MTVCIAAICENGNAIVFASDREYGIEYTSGEFHDPKVQPLFRPKNPGNWSVAFAGTVPHAIEVIGTIRRYENEIESRSWFDLMSALEKNYRRVRLSKAEGEIFSARGWTLEQFQKHGSQQLPPTTYANLDTRLGLYNLDASLLVAGFASDDFPAILSVDNPGVAREHSKIGFWCIGSGTPLAQASMFGREYSWGFSLEKAVYSVFEAKRNAERATGVGRRITDVIIVTRKTAGRLDQYDELNKIYAELQPQQFQDKHQTALQSMPIFQKVRASL